MDRIEWVLTSPPYFTWCEVGKITSSRVFPFRERKKEEEDQIKLGRSMDEQIWLDFTNMTTDKTHRLHSSWMALLKKKEIMDAS